jgi:Flp pilus assembly protein TadD
MKKDYGSASPTIAKVIKRDPDVAKGYVDRGWIYVLKSDLDKAEADFAAALKLHENDASALVGRGVVKSRKASLPTAAPIFRCAETRARHRRRDQEARHQQVSPHETGHQV